METGKNQENYLRELRAWLAETENQPLEEMDAFFTHRIEGYEEHMLSHWADDYKLIANTVPENARRILDLGCGTGLELDRLFERFPNANVVGIDLSASMLEKLRAKPYADRLELICASYFDEPFPGPFDAVISVESLHHFTAAEKLPLFKKIHEALRPGGVFLNCDYLAGSPEEEMLLRETCDRRRAQENIPADVFIHFDTPLTVEHELEVLRKAGFESVSAEPAVEAILITVKKA